MFTPAGLQFLLEKLQSAPLAVVLDTGDSAQTKVAELLVDEKARLVVARLSDVCWTAQGGPFPATPAKACVVRTGDVVLATFDLRDEKQTPRQVSDTQDFRIEGLELRLRY